MITQLWVEICNRLEAELDRRIAANRALNRQAATLAAELDRAWEEAEQTQDVAFMKEVAMIAGQALEANRANDFDEMLRLTIELNIKRQVRRHD